MFQDCACLHLTLIFWFLNGYYGVPLCFPAHTLKRNHQRIGLTMPVEDMQVINLAPLDGDCNLMTMAAAVCFPTQV